MKTLLICLIMSCSVRIYAQPNCPIDSIAVGGMGVPTIDTNVIGADLPSCINCPATECTSWAIPDNFDGLILLRSTDTTKQYSVQIVSQCRYLRFDTCGALRPMHNGVGFMLRQSIIGDAQIYVCGSMGDTVIATCVVAPLQPSLGPPYLDLATCQPHQPPTGIDQPLETCTEFRYFDIVHCRHTSERNRHNLPSGIYWQWCGEWWNGKKILVP
jgi:hypothetical protein